MLLERPYLALYPFALVLAAALAAGLTPVAALAARRLGAVASPRPDRWHTTPTPLLGGLAIFLAAAAAFVLVPQPLQPDRFERFGYLLIGAAAIFALGLYDDLRHLPPYTKLLGQIIAACVLVFGQLHLFGRPSISPVLAPFAILWIVGVTNAFNLLDNMDGLSAGIAVVVGLTLFASSHLAGDRQTALVSLIVAGAAAGFLVHNFNPARVFMGDCGSLLLGYLLSGLTVIGAAEGTGGVTAVLLVPVLVMALPLLDTVLVATLRLLHGRSIAQGGRDHLSHRLVALGLSERRAVLVLYLVAVATGALAVASPLVGIWTTTVLFTLMALGMGFFALYLAQVRIYSDAEVEQLGRSGRLMGRLVLGGRQLLYKQQIAAMLLDLALVMVALLGAYLLRFEGELEPLFLSQFARIVPIAVSFKLAVFLGMGVYRGIWRHMGLADAWLVVRASALGSLLTTACIALLFGVDAVPRAVLLLDWLLFTLGVIATRRSFDLIHHLLTQSRQADVVRVLVIGAGDAGELVLRALGRSRRHAYRAVGFLDDSERYRDRTVHGVRVLGRLADLAEVARRERVDQVVVALPSEEATLAALRQCAELGLPALDLAGFLKAELQTEPAAAGVAGA